MIFWKVYYFDKNDLNESSVFKSYYSSADDNPKYCGQIKLQDFFGQQYLKKKLKDHFSFMHVECCQRKWETLFTFFWVGC